MSDIIARMMKPQWKLKSSIGVFKHPRMTLVEDTIDLPDGSTIDYLYRKHGEGDSAGVIVYDSRANKVLLSQEYSYPPDEVMWQLPGGGVEPGESLSDAAAREAKEETGIIAKELVDIGAFYTDNRRSSQKQHIFVVTEYEQSEAEPEVTEDILNTWTPVDEVDALISQGKVVNVNMLAAWSLFKVWLKSS